MNLTVARPRPRSKRARYSVRAHASASKPNRPGPRWCAAIGNTNSATASGIPRPKRLRRVLWAIRDRASLGTGFPVKCSSSVERPLPRGAVAKRLATPPANLCPKESVRRLAIRRSLRDHPTVCPIRPPDYKWLYINIGSERMDSERRIRERIQEEPTAGAYFQH